MALFDPAAGPPPLPCPDCGRPTSPVRSHSFALDALDAEKLVECMTPNCPKFGSRWKGGELANILLGIDETAEDARPSWDEQFMDIARITARRATCDRSHVGCVLTVDRRIVSTGYNGSFAGAEHCDDVGHHMVKGRCTRTVHAEMNAVAEAARRGVSVEGATAYLTRLPCAMCLKLLIAAGVERVVCDTVIKPEYIEEAVWLANEGQIDLEYPDQGNDEQT